MRGWWWGDGTGCCWAASLLLTVAQLARGYDLDITSQESIKSTASSMAEDMMSFYNGNEPGNTPGLLPSPYYWWEAGAMLGALVDYWYYTGDTKWNAITQQGLLYQVGPHNDYMPPNQTLTEGNDDQGFWGMAVMSAAEYNFDNPPAGQPQWLALAQAVFNTQAPRWDTQDCNGGLRWQIFTWNNGYDYKNSISQACFFNLAARLALYTGNQSYAEWADRTWDWMAGVGFLNTDSYYVYDGASIDGNCSKIVPYQWTYNAGGMLLGAAAMYNYTTGATRELWRERVDGLINGTHVFFTGNNSDIMTEVACEGVNLCDVDEQSFKAYLSRWMAATTKWAPWSYSRIKPLLESSAVAAAAQCTGGSNGRMCGLRWTLNGTFDGLTGVGQQMAAMEVVLANMIGDVSAPVTNSSGGTSQGDPSAGSSDVGRTDPENFLDMYAPIRAGDRAGAYILTVLVLLAMLVGMAFMFIDETSDKTPAERWADLRHHVAAPGAAFRAAAAAEKDKGKSVDRSSESISSSSDSGVVPVLSEKKEAHLVVTQRAVPVDGPYTPEHWRRRTSAPLSGDLAGAAGDPRRGSVSIMPSSHPHSRVRELSRERLSQMLAEGIEPPQLAGDRRRQSEALDKYYWGGRRTGGDEEAEQDRATAEGRQRPYSYA
ncbi:Glycoside hydrolase family 76 protein [Pleurostoma richardsiae]|uniref:mannan endo-1,6-alpha-mannosidase n=1 Tax=Pleurostoma richardsiae TaxID=41990 RepID=A0AA38VJ89_9PEZI|nr:Glycoside hydrolase family 76 protein [Pleurostoma richardsiae]